MDEAIIPTSGHCALGRSRPPTYDWTTDAVTMAARIACADFPAEGTTDQTVERRLLFSFVSPEDFELMLEVDLAYIDWLRRRNIL